MALMACVGSRAREALLLAAEEAVKESDTARLEALLTAPGPGGTEGLSGFELGQRHLLHQAAWLGHTACVRLLLEHGAPVDEPHRKNGCTPLHLAHFCTIDDTDPARTIGALTAAGAEINNQGGVKCGRLPIEHAVQHQRVGSVRVLLSSGSMVPVQTVLVAIDVASPQIVELLLQNGAECGPSVASVGGYWGQPLQQALNAPIKCPRESFKQMFRLLVQATVCSPYVRTTMNADASPFGDVTQPAESKQQQQQQPASSSTSTCAAVDAELRSLCRDSPDLTHYLLVVLTRNGYRPAGSCLETVRRTSGLGGADRLGLSTSASIVDWAENYLRSGPPTLTDLVVRVVRTALSQGRCRGNIVYGLRRLSLPSRITSLILMNG